MKTIVIDRGNMELRELPDFTLSTLQGVVGGYIERVFEVPSADRPEYFLIGYGNEESRYNSNFTENVMCPPHVLPIVGPIVVVAVADDPELPPVAPTDGELEQLGLVRAPGAALPVLHFGIWPSGPDEE